MPGDASGSRPVVLVVDDDPSILTAVERLLHRSEVEVMKANGSLEALNVLNQMDIGVVITDYMMPAMNGIELLILVREKWPRISTIMMTASSDMRVAADAVNRHLIDYFITKPWKNKPFVKLVEDAVEDHHKAVSVVEQPVAQVDPPPAQGQQGVLFGKYHLVGHIAAGGMAELLRARMYGAGGFEKDVAVKKILPHLNADPGFVQMFMDEARIMTTLNHGNIVSVIDFGEVDGEYFLVMEYVDGTDLRRLIDKPGNLPNPLPEPTACFVAQQIAQGLAYAHRKTGADGQSLQLVHRDIGPQNVLVSLEGSVKIADFGIARAAGRVRTTQAGLVKGTLHYMSPEQVCARPIDHRTDIYALGCVLYEMVTGRTPFEGANHQETVARINRGVYPKPNAVNKAVDRRLASVIHRALRKNSADRYPTADEMYAAISDYLHKAGLHPTAADLATLVNERVRDDRAAEMISHRLQ